MAEKSKTSHNINACALLYIYNSRIFFYIFYMLHILLNIDFVQIYFLKKNIFLESLKNIAILQI